MKEPVYCTIGQTKINWTAKKKKLGKTAIVNHQSMTKKFTIIIKKQIGTTGNIRVRRC